MNNFAKYLDMGVNLHIDVSTALNEVQIQVTMQGYGINRIVSYDELVSSDYETNLTDIIDDMIRSINYHKEVVELGCGLIDGQIPENLSDMVIIKNLIAEYKEKGVNLMFSPTQDNSAIIVTASAGDTVETELINYLPSDTRVEEYLPTQVTRLSLKVLQKSAELMSSTEV